jgi:hypothetical protein
MARRFFQAEIKRARVTVSGMTTADMWEIGDKFNTKMKQRILAAKTIDDVDARPLSEKYKIRKIKKTPFPYRNLYYSGDMLRAMRVVSVDQNTARIFFSYGPMAQRMAYNQRRSRQWGVSPSDAQYLSEIVDKKMQFKIERQTKMTVAA